MKNCIILQSHRHMFYFLYFIGFLEDFSPYPSHRQNIAWLTGSWRPGQRSPWRKSRLEGCNPWDSGWCLFSAGSQRTQMSWCRIQFHSYDEETDLWIQDSIISQAISLSLWLRCWPNSGSGQWRSRMKDWRASSFQNRSSEVAQPLLKTDMLKLLVSHVCLF